MGARALVWCERACVCVSEGCASTISTLREDLAKAAQTASDLRKALAEEEVAVQQLRCAKRALYTALFYSNEPYVQLYCTQKRFTDISSTQGR